MNNVDIILPMRDFLLFAALVIHVTTVLFIASVYVFASKFLDDRFYIPLALGWFLNACYLAMEAALVFISAEHKRTLEFSLFTAAVGILSIPLFHYSLKIKSKTRTSPGQRMRPLLFGILVVTLCLVGGLWAGSFAIYSPALIFAIFTFPAAFYSSWILLLVGNRFYRLFPEDVHGIHSRILYGSWAAYAILQFFYPFRLYFGSERAVFVLLFSLSFILKVLSLIGLLNVLRKSYSYVQAEMRATSVLADIGNVAAGLHHDIANPLSWIDSELSLLAQKRASDEIVTRSIEKIRKPMGLIDSAIKFVSLIRADPEAIAQKFRRINIKQPIEFSIGLFKKRYPNNSMHITQPDGRHFYVRAHNDLLAEAFQNIINNAYEASARSLGIRVRRLQDAEPRIEFSFINDGNPLTDEERTNCFRPGWSSKDKIVNNANIGMGLYMASKIISIHRGEISIDNQKDKSGVIVKVCLPAAIQTGDKNE